MTMAVTTSPEPDAIIGMGVPHMLNTALLLFLMVRNDIDLCGSEGIFCNM